MDSQNSDRRKDRWLL